MTDKELYAKGWFIVITPLAKINPDEWVLGVCRKGKTSWITEKSKDGFSDPTQARQWAEDYIKQHKLWK